MHPIYAASTTEREVPSILAGAVNPLIALKRAFDP
jgi:hypothetical protein